jgi:hypothetical protein
MNLRFLFYNFLLLQCLWSVSAHSSEQELVCELTNEVDTEGLLYIHIGFDLNNQKADVMHYHNDSSCSKSLDCWKTFTLKLTPNIMVLENENKIPTINFENNYRVAIRRDTLAVSYQHVHKSSALGYLEVNYKGLCTVTELKKVF